MDRLTMIGRSNNTANPKQNLCIKAVCEYLGVNSEYLHTLGDLIECISGPYTVSTRRMPHQYVVVIRGAHCALLDSTGMVLVDTAPGQGQVEKVYYVN